MLKKIQDVVAKQAEDDGLWFVAQTVTEAYLQQELRKLHAAVEGDYARPDNMECPLCHNEGFADPETRSFVTVNSGVTNMNGHDADVRWHEGWIVCRECGHTEWSSDST